MITFKINLIMKLFTLIFVVCFVLGLGFVATTKEKRYAVPPNVYEQLVNKTGTPPPFILPGLPPARGQERPHGPNPGFGSSPFAKSTPTRGHERPHGPNPGSGSPFAEPPSSLEIPRPIKSDRISEENQKRLKAALLSTIGEEDFKKVINNYKN